MNWPWQRKRNEPERAPDYWKPAERVALVWRFGDEGGESTFHVEAPTAEEAEAWARAASRTGKHAEVNAHLPEWQPKVHDPLNFRQTPCPCCVESGNPETRAGCAGPGPNGPGAGWVKCITGKCRCFTPASEGLCEDCYIETK